MYFIFLSTRISSATSFATYGVDDIIHFKLFRGIDAEFLRRERIVLKIKISSREKKENNVTCWIANTQIENLQY